MKPPRLPSGRALGWAPPAHSVSVFDLVEQSPWAGSIVAGRPFLVSWRTALAAMLREVDIAPVASAIWPTFQGMADQIVARVRLEMRETPSQNFRVSYFDWLDLWCEQFAHWHDPVRSLVAGHCTSGDAAKVAGQFPLFAGLAFADFVVTAVEAYDEREAWRAVVMGEPQPALSLPVDVRRDLRNTAMERVCNQLYDAFRDQARVPTSNAPIEYSLVHLVADIYTGCDDRTSNIVAAGADQ